MLQPEPPEACHERHTACAKCVDQHANRCDWQCVSICVSDLRDGVLNEDTHERVGGGDPSI